MRMARLWPCTARAAGEVLGCVACWGLEPACWRHAGLARQHAGTLQSAVSQPSHSLCRLSAAGPVVPFPGHQAAPGSAEFAKGPTPPGGAAAAAEADQDWQEQQHRLAAEAGAEDMHVGPVAPSPGHEPAPGTAEFVKGPSPPGGAAASSAASEPATSAAGSGAAVGSEVHVGPVSPFSGHQEGQQQQQQQMRQLARPPHQHTMLSRHPRQAAAA
ncbi:hypothetical protein COO60DRAFT_837206 [Scenedesmus sp. NREL 46B-D3]|nr:hypothetical protein COO60DRAFT_837206 [Scenedesmus sp. NREL 46B-D3]